MGAWGVRAFENDAAGDWSFELTEVDDLSLVEAAFEEVEAVGADYLEADAAANALAACEVLARLRGNTGYSDSSTEPVDSWVASHPQTPSPELIARGTAAIDRLLGSDSELRELWEESDPDAWRGAVGELRDRLQAQQGV